MMAEFFFVFGIALVVTGLLGAILYWDYTRNLEHRAACGKSECPICDPNPYP